MSATPASASATRKVIPIIPYSVKGRYRNRKTAIALLAFAVFFSLPWLTWHGNARSGQPLLFDIAHSRFDFFDIVLFPQDLMVFVVAMVFAATFLFMSAALYGRIFCGFFCFQTVWTDAFRAIERLVQGEAQARIRLRKQPWAVEKIIRLALTHALWLAFAFATALTFTLYFAEARTLAGQLIDGQAPLAAYACIIVLTATTYVAAGLAREDICRVACPYGKFQSVMQDLMTRTVVYDEARGERSLGRIASSKGLKELADRATQGYGDCVDCGYCVNVCPTGVDIRKGFQIDCISCGLCIDACDNIMQALKQPPGLIQFRQMPQQTQAVDGALPGQGFKRYGYLTILVICLGLLAYQLNHLEPYSATIQQQAQPLATRLANGDLRSRYVVRLSNKHSERECYRVTVEGMPARTAGAACFEVPAGKTYTYVLNVVLAEEQARRTRHITVSVTPASQPAARCEYRLGYVSVL